MEIVETRAFTKRLIGLLTDEQYREFQTELLRNPELGDPMTGTGGLRKARVAAGGHGKGRGARVVYYWAKARDTILLLFIHLKGEMEQLTKDQEKALAALVRKEYG